MSRSLLLHGIQLGLGAMLLLSLLTGCSSLRLSPSTAELPSDLPPFIELENTPFFPQEKNHCGPAALATLLNQRQIAVLPETLAERTFLPGLKGSLQIELAATARHYGLLVYPLTGNLNSLLKEVAAGNPVLVLQNLGFGWFPRWHYAVVVGYDLQRRELILRSGKKRRRVTGFQTFLNTWHRGGNWGIVTLPPDTIPVTASTLPYLTAANDLALSNNPEAAHQAYLAASQAWPKSASVWLTLGNSAYTREEWSLALEALQTAVKLDPNNPAGWNNLAYALLAFQRNDEALAAIDQAISITPADPNLQDSRREILRAQSQP